MDFMQDGKWHNVVLAVVFDRSTNLMDWVKIEVVC